MFDLVDLLNKKQNTESIEQQRITSVLFYQTLECQNFVEEAYRFEGIVPPVMAENQDEQITEHVRHSDVEIVIIELNRSQDVSQDAVRIRHLLPNQASVIVIGSEDAISTIRNLKDMGFYYVFWPVTKHELMEFVRSVHENRQRSSHRGPGQKRSAKYITFVGSKGGVGTSLVCAEVAHQLSINRKTSCLVVDQHYFGGNLDILMGMKKFEKRTIQPGSLASTLDSSSAQSLLHKHNSMLSVLALSAEQLDSQSLLDYSNAVIEQLSEDVNFILEDLSASVSFGMEADKFITQADIVVLILEPTVSSVREAARIKSRLNRMNAERVFRLLIVLNHTVATPMETASKAEAESVLNQPIDIEIPYCEQMNHTLLENKRIGESKLDASTSFVKLTALLLGENPPVEKFSSMQWIKRLMRKA